MQWGLLLGALLAVASGAQLPSCESKQYPCIWPNDVPQGCPLKRSDVLKGIQLGRNLKQPQTGADTWYPSWSKDGRLYSSFTDGCVTSTTGEKVCCSSGKEATADTGVAIIDGTDPFNLTVHPLGCVTEPGSPNFPGRYPSAVLHYGGTWWYGTYALANVHTKNLTCGAWCRLGPFAGFRHTQDEGKTWVLSSHYNLSNDYGLFENLTSYPIHMGAPHVADLGMELEHSPDGNAYIVGMWCDSGAPGCSWMGGDGVAMARARPDPSNPGTLNDPSNWEFFGGRDEHDRAIWGRPVLEWKDHGGVSTLSYHPGLERYLMVVSTPDPSVWPSTAAAFDTYILESRDIAGPYNLITYMANFGEEAYFVHVPTRFMKPDGTGVIMYSANYADHMVVNPPASGYGMCVVEYTFCHGECPAPVV